MVTITFRVGYQENQPRLKFKANRTEREGMPKHYEYPSELDYRLKIQPPSGEHRVFRIIKKLKAGGTKAVRLAELDAVNNALLAGRLSQLAARKEVELLVERLYREAGVKKFRTVSNNDNYAVLEQFWADYYRRRRLVDRDSAYAKYRRAVEAVGALSLRTASNEELQQAIDRGLQGNKQRAVVGRLKTILRWLKRGEVDLVLDHEVEEEVRYLTHEELERALQHVDDATFALMARVARGTGARMGELFALQPSKDGKTVFVRHQVRRDGTQALAKSKKADSPGRTVFVLPEYRPLLKEWMKVRGEVTLETRLNAANLLRAACEKAFPNNRSKHVKFHDLRHSYAIELAQAGVSLLQISQQLGNSERICQKHYTGYMATDETAEMIERKLKKAD